MASELTQIKLIVIKLSDKKSCNIVDAETLIGLYNGNYAMMAKLESLFSTVRIVWPSFNLCIYLC